MAAPGLPGIPAIPPVQGKAEMALDAARVYADEEAKRKRLECRFYQAQYPEIEEVVMVNVRNIAEMGAYVVLLEYNDIEGMILLSELSRRRIRSINKLIRVNRNEVAMVLRVDKEKVCLGGESRSYPRYMRQVGAINTSQLARGAMSGSRREYDNCLGFIWFF